jgi:hypothetical protein
MTRENLLYGEERRLPYLVQLVRLDSVHVPIRPDMPPTLVQLDLRGGEFSRPTTYQLEKFFDWITKALNIRKSDLTDYALMITPMPQDRDEEITGGRTPYIPDDWPATPDRRLYLRERSFLWVPVAYSEQEERYAWQRS